MSSEPTNAAAESRTAPRVIVALVADLIFASRITAVAHQAGVAVSVARTADQARALLAGAGGLIVDLHLEADDPLELIRELKHAGGSVPIVAFGSHVQTQLLQAARDAGAETVLPRSKFTRDLDEILRQLAAPQG
jgi:DNA-binding NarL/FixJ family response regulator